MNVYIILGLNSPNPFLKVLCLATMGTNALRRGGGRNFGFNLVTGAKREKNADEQFAIRFTFTTD